MDLNRKDFHQLVELLVPLVDTPTKQRALLQLAFLGTTIPDQVNIGDAAWVFATNLVTTCKDYGMLDDGEHALIALLNEIQSKVGKEGKARIQTIRDRFTRPLQSVDSDVDDIYILLQRFFELYQRERWEESLLVLSMISQNNNVPPYFEMMEYQAEVEAAIQNSLWERERDQAYETLKIIIANERTPHRKWRALQTFWRQYPGYDPDNFCYIALEHDKGFQEALRRIKREKNRRTDELNLEDLQLKALPNEIIELPELEALYLTHNQLMTLPEALGSLSKLEVLDLDGNQFKSLPSVITHLTNLQVLSASGNSLRALPARLTRLKKLQELYLNDNQLDHLPLVVPELPNLEVLYLNENRLRTLPSELGQAVRLRLLSLNSNALASLPPAVGELRNLRTLSLVDASLVSFPMNILKLTQLEKLFLDYNDITDIPQEIGDIVTLEWLSLGSNRLVELPASVTKLERLHTLYVHNNNLDHIPIEIGQMPSLRQIRVKKGNSLYNIPAGIVDGGDTEILTWLQSQAGARN